jgi:hypothetical protein
VALQVDDLPAATLDSCAVNFVRHEQALEVDCAPSVAEHELDVRPAGAAADRAGAEQQATQERHDGRRLWW